MTLRILIVVFAVAGLVDAVYFTLAYYGRVKKSRWVPKSLCAPEGSSCVPVLQTSYARVFGVPNSLLGILYYLAVIGWILLPGTWFVVGFSRAMSLARAALWLLIPASVATVGLGFYLIHALRRRLHIDCPLCYTAHAINAVLLALLILSAR